MWPVLDCNAHTISTGTNFNLFDSGDWGGDGFEVRVTISFLFVPPHKQSMTIQRSNAKLSRLIHSFIVVVIVINVYDCRSS